MAPSFADMVDLLRELQRAGVDFIVVGGHAMAAHGKPRDTGDLDVWVRPTPENAPRVLAALRAFGAPTFGMTIEELTTPGNVLQFGVEPNRIDILTGIDGVTFDEAWASRIQGVVVGVSVSVIGLEALKANKRAAARDKDLVDVKVLEAAAKNKR